MCIRVAEHKITVNDKVYSERVSVQYSMPAYPYSLFKYVFPYIGA